MAAKRVAFVTGGMGGLGAAISRRLHDAGMVVAMSHSERNDHVATWLTREREAGRHFLAFEADVSSFDSCAHCAERLLAEFGAVDVLINNAGITRDASFAKMTKEDWDTVLRTDLDSMFNMTKPLLPAMVKQRFGRIVNVSSVNGARGVIGLPEGGYSRFYDVACAGDSATWRDGQHGLAWLPRHGNDGSRATGGDGDKDSPPDSRWASR